MKRTYFQIALVAALVQVTGCVGIYEQTHAYFGSPKFSMTNPAAVQVLPAEPKRPNDRLGEVVLAVEGNASREELEAKLKQGGAQLGADAVYITRDRTHVVPNVYGDGWFGPGDYYNSEYMRREIVAVAIKYK
jgi:hypothetical protein